MRRLLPLVLALVAPAVPAPAGDDGGVVEVRLGWGEGHGPGLLPGRLRVAPEPPEGVAAPPGFERGVFARTPVPGGSLLVAVDLTVDGERTWVDIDMDGELADEEPAAWETNSRARMRSFHLRLRYDDEAEPVAVPFLLYRMKGWEPEHLQVYAKVHRSGSVLLGGRVRAVAVVDEGGDGFFDDPGRDLLLVDLDGDGRLDPERGSADRVEPGAPFRAGNEVWIARVATASGGTLELRRASGAEPPPLRSWPLAAVPPSGEEWTPTGKALAPLIEAATARRADELPPIIADLGRDGTKPAFTALVTLASRNRSPPVRLAAAAALGNPAYRPFGSGTVLSSLAADSDTAVALAAMEALHAAGEPEREGVYLSLLDSPEGKVAGNAARWLAFLRSDRSRAGVLRILGTHPSPAARRLAWEGTRSFETPPPEEAIRAALEGGDRSLKIAVLRDLVLAGRAAAPGVALGLARPAPTDPEDRAALLEVLTLLDGAEAAEAVAAVVEAMDPRELERSARFLVPRLSAVRIPAMVDVYLRLLRSRSAAVRRLAVGVLAPHPDPAVAETLVATAGREEDAEVQAALGEALASGRNPAAVALLLRESRMGRVAMQRFAVRTLLAMGTGVPAVRELVAEYLAGRDEERRIRAMEVAVREEDLSLCPAVLPSLSHRSWAVRHAAARTLGALRCPESVGPMVERMAGETHLRVRVAIGQALHRITGVNLYEDAVLWGKWWQENREGFAMPPSPPPATGRDTEVSRAKFYGIPVESDHVVFVLDISGSMTRRDAKGRDHKVATRWEVAVEELLGAVESMGEGSFVGLVFFESKVSSWGSGLRRVGSGTKQRLRADLAKVQPSGDTNLFGGLARAFETSDADTIFLLSDGEPNEGSWWKTADILREVEALNAGRGVAIHCVSVGQPSALLRRLAAAHSGVYVER